MDKINLAAYPALNSQINSGKFSHAYIVSGPRDSRKDGIVAYIARAVVCAGAGQKPCGVCAHCKKAESGTHPDILRIEREEGKRELSVDRIRTVRSDAFVMPNEAQRKVYIIEDAGFMNPSAQNALLKVLEEPPSYAVFLLMADNPGALLPTIRSRCVEVPLIPGTASGGEMDAEAAKLMDILDSGDRMRILEYLGTIDTMSRDELSEFAAALRRCTVRWLLDAEELTGGLNREKLTRILSVCDRIQKYADAYVSPVHIAGLMLAELL